MSTVKQSVQKCQKIAVRGSVIYRASDNQTIRLLEFCIDFIHYIIEELGAEALPIPVQEEWQITGALKYAHPVYRFFPHKTKGEGFFLAVLRKAEGEIEEIRIKSKNKNKKEATLR